MESILLKVINLQIKLLIICGFQICIPVNGVRIYGQTIVRNAVGIHYTGITVFVNHKIRYRSCFCNRTFHHISVFILNSYCITCIYLNGTLRYHCGHTKI